jgi:predicted ATPase
VADQLERAAERFADTVHEYVTAKVREAGALERDRHDAELAELRERVNGLASMVAAHRIALIESGMLHSVKVPDHATTPVERGRYTE